MQARGDPRLIFRATPPATPARRLSVALHNRHTHNRGHARLKRMAAHLIHERNPIGSRTGPRPPAIANTKTKRLKSTMTWRKSPASSPMPSVRFHPRTGTTFFSHCFRGAKNPTFPSGANAETPLSFPPPKPSVPGGCKPVMTQVLGLPLCAGLNPIRTRKEAARASSGGRDSGAELSSQPLLLLLLPEPLRLLAEVL